MNEKMYFAELLCTRLCHDLTGPIGAVNNGAEFLSEEGFDLQSQAVDLIVSSAFSAVSRLQFYRIAYGNVKEHGEANLSEKQKIASDFFVGTKIELDWPETHTDAAGISISLKMLRLTYNLLVIASSALIRGGKISVRLDKDDSLRKVITVLATGANLKWDSEAEKVFSVSSSDCVVNTKNVQLHLTRHYADDLKAAVEWKVGADELVLRVVQSSGE
ncbi:MAG: histidine phosphotransferase family protein [Pseudomonadota bacterium]